MTRYHLLGHDPDCEGCAGITRRQAWIDRLAFAGVGFVLVGAMLLFLVWT